MNSIMLPYLTVLTISTSEVMADIQVIAASEIQEIQGNCLQLFTCTTGPIQGNLFWYAQFVNGSEIRFARNDGGNAEPNPPYNEITLDGATDYYTSVTREVMNGDLFTNFNSTLAFDGIFSIRSKIAFVICGSVNSNSSKIPIQLPQIKEDSYQLKKSIHLKDTYVCTGNNIPLKLNVGSCSLNTSNDVLQWSIDGTTVLHYSYNMGSLIEVYQNLSNYTVITKSLQLVGDHLNVTSNLQFDLSLPIGSSIYCGSNFVRSNEIQFSSKFEVESNFTLIYTGDELDHIIAEWNNVQVNNENMTVFTIVLRGDTNQVLNEIKYQCYMQKCVEVIPVANYTSKFYEVMISVLDIGSSSNISSSLSNYMNYSLNEEKCMLNVCCSAMINETCSIYFTSDTSNIMRNETIENSDYITLDLNQVEIYWFELNATYKDLKISIKTNHSFKSMNRNILIGTAVTFFIFGIVFLLTGYGVFIMCFLCNHHISLFRETISCSLIPLLFTIIALVLWISYATLSNGDCDIGSSKYNILLAASVFSFLLPLLSIVSLGGFILSVGRKKDEGVMSIDSSLPIYDFKFYMEPMKPQDSHNFCSNCKKFILYKRPSHYCPNCGVKMCRNCRSNKENNIYIWRNLYPSPVCRTCYQEYQKENEEFSQGDTVKEISDYLRLKMPHFCNECENNSTSMEKEGNDILTAYYNAIYGEFIASKCGICEAVLCNDPKNQCYNRKCVIQIEEMDCCSLCYILSKRMDHHKQKQA